MDFIGRYLHKLRDKAALSWLCLFSLFSSTACVASDSLTGLSLEALMNIDASVTSLSKREQPLSETPASAYVISRDQIEQSTARSIPELLRVVPGVNVARYGAQDYAISIRGYNDYFANKVLILIDGRSAYNPVHTGIYWEEIDLPLAMIERIEIIKGPGGAIWGANAANGVINIITRTADPADGSGASVAFSEQENGIVDLFQTGTVADWNWRTDTRYSSYDDYDVNDRSLNFKARLDRETADSEISWSTGLVYTDNQDRNDAYQPSEFTFYTVDDGREVYDVFIQGEYTHSLSPFHTETVKAYWQRNQREDIFMDLRYDIVDLELRRNLITDRHNLVYGANWRYYRDHLKNKYDDDYWIFRGYSSDNPDLTNNTYSVFINDEISLAWGDLTLGLKGEYTDYNGMEWFPTARVAIPVPSFDNALFWASYSRSATAPSRAYKAVDYMAGYYYDDDLWSYYADVIKGNEDYKSEKITAFEMGLKGVLQNSSLEYDLSLFYNRYDDGYSEIYIGYEYVNAWDVIDYYQVENLAEADAYGMELSLRKPLDQQTSLGFGYSYFSLDERLPTAAGDYLEKFHEGSTPKNQFVLWLQRQISPDLHVAASLRASSNLHEPYLGELKMSPILDLSLTSQLDQRTAMKVTVLNLMDSNVPEFGYGLPQRRELWLQLNSEF